ncbi:3-phosphoshikimate 1-carboxyvinyltransferase [Olsenella urininfantis]|uniref:3-phosphoshikimate 1-carboxyvinyltransferase n=1 Tax=Olsenella urininfantis TaxID=1871033 RepID=UPI00098548BA|nr:3-phosphoshikimate 1-carboxyvinyltransferase [Olsenella urininfantis]
MDVTITPHPLSGNIPAIASKSAAHRLLILAALAEGITDLDCDTSSLDIEATAGCLRALGAQVTRTKLGFRVRPLPRDAGGAATGRRDARLDCGESGSTLRFMLPVLCGLSTGGQIEVSGRLSQRPLSPLFEQLSAHGAHLSEKGSFPLKVAGRMSGGRFELPGNVSSQYVSGLLMAAPLLSEGLEVEVERPVESKAYVDMTLDALASFGASVQVTEGEGCVHYGLSAGTRLASPGRLRVEGDWSNAAFWLCAGALGGEGVTVQGLDGASAQGDRCVMLELASLGARCSTRGRTATCASRRLAPAEIDASKIPDLVPPLAATCCLCPGESRIVNAGRLRLKESDRLASVSAALSAMGARITTEGDALLIQGVASLAGGDVDAANDHRIAMMSAIAAAYASGPTTIHGAECVAKSYPGFFDDFRLLGGIVKESEVR